MLQRFGPLMNPGGAAISLTYIASERIIPGQHANFATGRQMPHLGLCLPASANAIQVQQPTVMLYFSACTF